MDQKSGTTPPSIMPISRGSETAVALHLQSDAERRQGWLVNPLTIGFANRANLDAQEESTTMEDP